MLAGSASRATLAQVAAMCATHDAYFLDPLDQPDPEHLAAAALEWAKPRIGDRPVLVYASSDPGTVRRVQAELGRERAGAIIEQALRLIARGLVEAGVRRLVVAGGETSGAVVSALGVKSLQIGREIDPGVPWTMALGEPRLFLALKSGNFGGEDFLTRAFEVLE